MALFEFDLTVKHDNNGVFADRSLAASRYDIDEFTTDLVAAEDYLYAGLYKPFNRLYLELKTANTTANTLAGEFWNGSAWTSLSNLVDRSVGMTRNGFLEWKRDQTDWAKTTVDGDELFWVRFRPSVDIDPGTEIQGLNIVFSDDEQLAIEFSEINQLLGSNRTSFINLHQAARDQIVQELRNQSEVKRRANATGLANLTKWDLLDIDEIAQAAKYKALEKIFFEISDNTDDKWYQRFNDYRGLYGQAMQLAFLTLDRDDDGVVDDSERVASRRIVIERV